MSEEEIIETLAEKVGVRTISQASGGAGTGVESSGQLSPLKLMGGDGGGLEDEEGQDEEDEEEEEEEDGS